MIEAFITNLGKYNEGQLCGEYLKFPATTEDVQEVLSNIGVDGVLYEGFFISEYRIDEPVSCLLDCLGERESIDELNYLTALLEEMDKDGLEKFGAMVEYGNYTGSVKDLINLAQNLDSYHYFHGVKTEKDLGTHMIEELCMLEVPDNLAGYFNYEAYGHDIFLGNSGTFATCGYIEESYGSFPEHYAGLEDLPEEHKIFAYPDPPEKMSIKEQLAVYANMVTGATAKDTHKLAYGDR